MSAVPAPRQPPLDAELTAFVADLRWEDVPADVRRRLAWLLLDFAAVCRAGRDAPASALAADHAVDAHGAGPATALLDGRMLSVPGASWANGVLANVLDYDDGHRITKGHPGAMVIPAALAVAQANRRSLRELLEAIVVGYEISIRAGIRLHEREARYHASGAWGALGAAAATARLLRLQAPAMVHALGLAEYHAPIALIMRSVADPAMTKDATGWGAFLGASSAMLAARGYTALAPEFLLEGAPLEVGTRWHLPEVYVKPYPCCRWTQPAIHAALQVRREGLEPRRVRRIVIHTFQAADGLSWRRPATTEDMQYSLVWPVAVALASGAFGVDEVLADASPEAASLVEHTEVVVDPELTSAFPARRLTRVRLELEGDETLDSGVVEAPGEPDDASWEGVIERKARARVRVVDPPGAAVAGDAEQLLDLLTYGAGTEERS